VMMSMMRMLEVLARGLGRPSFTSVQFGAEFFVLWHTVHVRH
jgi:hypothetical protein